MSEAYVVAEDPYFDSSPVAVGDGTIDDTAAIQHHINLMALFKEPRPLLLSKVYKLTSTLVIPAMDIGGGTVTRVKLHGFNRKTGFGDPNTPSTLLVAHTGTALEVNCTYFEMEGLQIKSYTVGGLVAGADDTYAVYVKQTASHSKLAWNEISRAGGKAGVRIDVGGCRFDNNEVVIQGQNPAQWSYDASKLAPVQRHAVYLQSVADAFISHNQMAGQGAGLFTDSCSGVVIHDNLIFNSMEGIVLQGAARCTVHDNRVDEHYRQGIVIDWNTGGCTIHDNLVHNNGAWTANPNVLERAGMVLRSGLHNNIHGNMFDNWPHNIQQPGNLDFNNPQQYALVVQGVGSGSPVRPLPTNNLIMGNVVRNQIQSAPFQNNGDATNKFIGNTGNQFTNGLYADSSNQPVSAGLTGPAAAVAAGAAGLVAFRNRGRRLPTG